VIFGDDFVTAAVVADGGAKRQVNIDREWRRCGLFQVFYETVFVESLIKPVGSRIRGITGAKRVKTAY